MRGSPAGTDAGGTRHGRRLGARSEHQPTGPDTTLSVGLKNAAALSKAQIHRSPSQLSDIAGVHRPFATNTPLWYYILAEAKALAGGLHLGPVGGQIVTETLIGLLRADPASYLNAHPRFRPFLGADLKLGPTPNPNITANRTYTHAHFLHYAGVVNPGTYR